MVDRLRNPKPVCQTKQFSDVKFYDLKYIQQNSYFSNSHGFHFLRQEFLACEVFARYLDLN